MMELNNIDKKKLFSLAAILAIGFGTLYFFKPKARKSMKKNDEAMKELPIMEREYLTPPVIDESTLGNNPKSDDAMLALIAYIQAYNEGVPQDELDSLNKDFSNDFGITIIRRRSDDKLVVQDLNAEPILVYPS